MADVANNGNGQRRLFDLVRGWVTLVLGVALVIWGVVTNKPGLLAIGGSLIGFNPLVRASIK